MRRTVLVLSFALYAAACSGDSQNDLPPGIRNPAVGSQPGTPAVGGGGDGGVNTDGGTGDGGTNDGGTDDGGITFDATEQGIRQFLQADGFRAFPSEPAAHAINMSHGGSEGRLFVNPALAASMNANATVHPIGSVAVLEVFTSDGTTVFGHSVMAKTESGLWNFFQGRPPDFANPQFFEGTNNFCAQCHASLSNDFIRSPATGIPTP